MADRIRIFTGNNHDDKPKLSNEVKLFVGDEEVTGVIDIDIQKITPDSIVTAVITVECKLGDK